ncbi:MAG TPA: PEGA domain-containing protein [Acidobacteriota bacterium]|jgi:hypothetical protein
MTAKRRCVVAVLLFLTPGLSFPQQSPIQTAASVESSAVGKTKILDGTPVKLRLNRTLSSASAHVDEKVDFEVLEEIRSADVLVIPKGSIAWGTVTEAHPKRRMGRGGKLNVNIDAVQLATGEKAPLRAIKDNQGGGHVGSMTGAMVATGILFFPAAPLFLFMKGKDITVPKGTEITAYISGDSFMSQPQPKPAAAIVPTPAPALGPTPTPDANHASITLKSTPEAAEITIGGKFFGSTPATIRLAPGDHMIIVAKTGFKSWEKTVSVTANSTMNVEAVLEKQP